jgi:hypothetical protein
MLWPMPGTIVYVWFLGVLKHKGIVSNRWWNGKPMLIANARGTSGVAEVAWDVFTSGNDCFVEGYPSDLPPLEVLYNARCLIGQPYNVAASNCEHFVYKCHGQEPKSPQFALVALIAILGVVAIAANS